MVANKRDYYEVLGVAKSSGKDEIKKSYRKLAMKYHPDKNRGNASAMNKFKEATEAYEVLANDEKRQTYDRFGHDAVNAAGAGGQRWDPNSFSGFEDIFGDMGSFGDIFENFFGGGRGRSSRRSGVKHGDDLRYDLEIKFEEAAFGIQKKIVIPRQETCHDCKGTGSQKQTKSDVCPDCGGSGQVRRSQGFFSISSACHRCQGSGYVIKDPCRACSGTGQVKKKRTISVKIPAGVESGSHLKITGEGGAGVKGGYNGDLYVVIHVSPHKYFERHENDVICEVPISFAQAALGAEITVPTLDGKRAKIKIPSGTQPGKIFRLRGQGIPMLGRSGKGDQLVKIDISVPKGLTSRQKELLREFAHINKDDTSPDPSSLFEKIKSRFT